MRFCMNLVVLALAGHLLFPPALSAPILINKGTGNSGSGFLAPRAPFVPYPWEELREPVKPHPHPVPETPVSKYKLIGGAAVPIGLMAFGITMAVLTGKHILPVKSNQGQTKRTSGALEEGPANAELMQRALGDQDFDK